MVSDDVRTFVLPSKYIIEICGCAYCQLIILMFSNYSSIQSWNRIFNSLEVLFFVSELHIFLIFIFTFLKRKF